MPTSKKKTPRRHRKLKIVLLNLLIAVIVLVAIGCFVMSSLGKYTMHGYSITVPSFQDMTEEEAAQLAQKTNLRVMVVDSVYDDYAAPGTVQEQYPSVGAKVKGNRMIQLTVCSQNPEQVAAPNLNNSSYRQALQTLKAKGFQVGSIGYAPSEFKNLVLYLKNAGNLVEGGAFLRKGAKIDIVLGDGGNAVNYVALPKLSGMRVRDAINLLQESYLNIGMITRDNSLRGNADMLSAVVCFQDPEFRPGKNVPAGSSVDMEVTLNRQRIAALDSLIITE